MFFLKETSKVIERFRIAYPQYWLDKLMSDIHASNKGGGAIITGQVLAILRHPQLEREVVIPGVGILRRPMDELRRLAYVTGLGGRLPREVMLGTNIVTNDGDVYYAQRGVVGSITDDFTAAGAGIRLGDDNTTPTKTDTDVTNFLTGTDHARDGTYPQTDDSDGDNTGAGVDIMTWTYSYLTSEGNASAIIEGAISDVRAGSGTAALTHFLFAALFNKTSSDTLKVIVNHEVLGV